VALELSREAGGAAGIADSLLALAGFEQGDTHPQERRRLLAEEALIHAREASDERFVALALMERALAISPRHATAELDQAATALHRLGSTRVLMWLYNNAAYNAIKAGIPDHARPLLAEAVPLARGLGGPVELALVYGNVGLEALFNGDFDRAQPAFDEQLRLCRQHVVTYLVAEGLGGLAAIATRRGDRERAARLLGAATAIGQVADADVDVQLDEQFFAPARALHGTERWNAAIRTGGEMTLEQAITFALSPGHTLN
jgi:tetratricopeptide (TPR) repeat protein